MKPYSRDSPTVSFSLSTEWLPKYKSRDMDSRIDLRLGFFQAWEMKGQKSKSTLEGMSWC